MPRPYIRLSGPLSRDKEVVKQSIFELVSNELFQSEVEKIRSKWEIDCWITEEELCERYETNDWGSYIEYFINNDKFRADVDQLIKTCKLHVGWHDFLGTYIVFNDEQVDRNMRDPEGPVLQKSIDEDDIDPVTGERLLILHLRPSTTLQDIAHAWPSIRFKETRKRRNKIWKTFFRDKEIYDLAKAGKTMAEIDRAIREKFGKSMDYGAIKTALSQYQTKMGIPKNKRAKLKTRS